LRIRFVKKFVLFVQETSLGENGKLHTQEAQHHINRKKIYPIDNVNQHGQVADIKFAPNSPIKGIAKNVNIENFEILQSTVGTKTSPSGCGGCKKYR